MELGVTNWYKIPFLCNEGGLEASMMNKSVWKLIVGQMWRFYSS